MSPHVKSLVENISKDEGMEKNQNKYYPKDITVCFKLSRTFCYEQIKMKILEAKRNKNENEKNLFFHKNTMMKNF